MFRGDGKIMGKRICSEVMGWKVRTWSEKSGKMMKRGWEENEKRLENDHYGIFRENYGWKNYKKWERESDVTRAGKYGKRAGKGPEKGKELWEEGGKMTGKEWEEGWRWQEDDGKRVGKGWEDSRIARQISPLSDVYTTAQDSNPTISLQLSSPKVAKLVRITR